MAWGGVLIGLSVFLLIAGLVGAFIGYLIAKWREKKIWKEMPSELLKQNEEVQEVPKNDFK